MITNKEIEKVISSKDMIEIKEILHNNNLNISHYSDNLIYYIQEFFIVMKEYEEYDEIEIFYKNMKTKLLSDINRYKEKLEYYKNLDLQMPDEIIKDIDILNKLHFKRKFEKGYEFGKNEFHKWFLNYIKNKAEMRI
jgi:hypothetical protein